MHAPGYASNRTQADDHREQGQPPEAVIRSPGPVHGEQPVISDRSDPERHDDWLTRG